MNYAIHEERSIVFALRIAPGVSGDVQPGVTFDEIAATRSDHANTGGRVVQALCISNSDPSHYRLYHDERYVDRDAFRRINKTHHLVAVYRGR